MSDPSGRPLTLTELLRLAVEKTPDDERELLRRCALVRTFDEHLFETVLRVEPWPVEGDELFEILTDSPFVEAVPRPEGAYRLTRDGRAQFAATWSAGDERIPSSLPRLRSALIAYYRGESSRDPDAELYQLIPTNPREALRRFEAAFAEAEAKSDLARCHTLLGLFPEPNEAPEELRPSLEAHRARANARALWSEEIFRTGSYYRRPQLVNDLERLMRGDDPECWAYQIHAGGGTGKTMFVRWAIARWCLPAGIPVARLDFDFRETADPAEFAAHPERLALQIATLWNKQIPGSPLDHTIDRLASPYGVTDPLGQLASALRLPDGVNALVVLDTLEEVLIPNRAKLLEILGHLRALHDLSAGNRIRVLLSGRYDLSRSFTAGELAVLGARPIHRKVFRLKDREARVFLTEYRGVPADDRVEAAVIRSRGNPLKLWLFSEILRSDPNVTADEILNNLTSAEVEYLIRRVVARIGEAEKVQKTGEIGDLHKQLRWVLRYGVVPRQLTLDFLLASPIRRRLENEITGREPVDEPEAVLKDVNTEGEKFPRAKTPPEFELLWTELQKYAGGSSWVRVASGSGVSTTLVFTPDVLNPMRDLLLADEHGLFVDLHTEALDYYQARADAAKAEPDPEAGERVRWLREVVYHDFQRRGEAAGDAWRGLIESDEFRARPAWRKLLAEEVTGRAYVEDGAGRAYVHDDDPPRPIVRKDGARMIAPETLALAYYHNARASADLARALTPVELGGVTPDDARQHWNDAFNAFGRYEKAAGTLAAAPDEPGPDAVALLGALILGNITGGDADAALEALKGLEASPDPMIVAQALDGQARLLLRNYDSEAVRPLRALLERDTPFAGLPRVKLLEFLARTWLGLDRLTEALNECDLAIREATAYPFAPDSDATLARLDVLGRHILLRAGSPEGVVGGRALSGGGHIEVGLRPVTWPAAVRSLEVDARLAQLDPHAALEAHRDARRLYGQVRRIKPRQTDLLPRKPEERAQRARVAAALMDHRRALDELAKASAEWLALTLPDSQEQADDLLARQAEICLGPVRDLKATKNLLVSFRDQPAADTVPTYSWVRVACVHAELAHLDGNTPAASAGVDAVLVWCRKAPSRARVLLALTGLSFGVSPTPSRWVEALVDALGEMTPPHARLARLGSLARCPRFEGVPDDLTGRFLSLTSEPLPTTLHPRDRAVLELRRVEVLRVGGRTAEAIWALDAARAGLVRFLKWGIKARTFFPVPALLRAEDRLGQQDAACRRAAELLPHYASEFWKDAAMLVASAWVEQAERAEVVRDDKAFDEATAEANGQLSRSSAPGTDWLRARLLRVRAKVAHRCGYPEESARHDESARSLERSLGLPDRPAPLAELATTPPPEGPAWFEAPFLPTHPVYTIGLGWKPDGALSVMTRHPGSTGRTESVTTALLANLGLSRASADSTDAVPIAAATEFYKQWDSRADELSAQILDARSQREIDTLGEATPDGADVRLDASDPVLSQFPWEFLTWPHHEGPVLVSAWPTVRHLYRSPDPVGVDPGTTRWVQAVLSRLFDRGLTVDGVDSERLRDLVRSFQPRTGLAVTGSADAVTRWELDRARRDFAGQRARVALIFRPDEGSKTTSTSLSIPMLFSEHGYEPIEVSSLGPEPASVRRSLESKTLSVIYVAAQFASAYSFGVHAVLSPATSKARVTGDLLTAKRLDEYLQSLPTEGPKPLVILDPPLPSSPFEAVLQLFLRNAFASELFRLGNAPSVLATGLDSPGSDPGLLGDLIRAAATGSSVGDLLNRARENPILRVVKTEDLLDQLRTAGTALFALDPDARVPGAKSTRPSAELFSGSTVTAVPDVPIKTRTLYALLVGIDNYPRPLPALRGCVNDVDVFANYLRERVGQSESTALELITLKNGEATRAAVISQFRSVLGKARKGDVAFFHFSGHGSQWQVPEELRKDEPGRLVPTFVFADSRTSGHWDLAAQELKTLIDEVSRSGAHLTVILDCSHAGSGTRGAVTAAVRRAPADLRDRPADTLLTPAGGRLKQGTFGQNGARCVVPTACRDNQEAKEYAGDGRHRGAFSFFLGEALKAAGGVPTYRDLIAQVSALVSAHIEDQTPFLEAHGPEDFDAVFLDGAVPPSAAVFTAAFRDGQWFLDGGAAHGVPAPAGLDTTRVALFPLEATADDLLDPRHAAARADVVEVFGGSSRLKVDPDGSLDRARPYQARVISLPMPPLTVVLKGDLEPCERVRGALAASSPDGDPSPFIRAAEPGEATLPEFRLVAREGRFDITRPDDDRPLVAPIVGQDLNAAVRAAARLEHMGRWTQTARLINPVSSIQAGDVRLTIVVDGKEAAGREVRLEYRGQEPPEIQICYTNTTSRTLYVALLDMTPEFEISAGLTREGCVRLGPGETGWVADGKPIRVTVSDALRDLGLVEAKDLLKLIASTREFHAGLLAQPPLDAPSRGPGLTRGRPAPATSSLGRLMWKVQTRGVSTEESTAFDDWQTSEVAFTTVRPLEALPLPMSGTPLTLSGGVTVVAPSGLRASARLSTESLGLRQIEATNLPRLLTEDPGVCVPFTLTRHGGIDPGLSVLELLDVAGESAVTAASPLRIMAPLALSENEYVVPVVFDGEFFLPVGRVESRGPGVTVVALHRLPPPSDDPRSGPTIRVFLEKVIGPPRIAGPDRPRLAVARPSPDGHALTFTADPASVRASVSAACRILLLIPGLDGDARGMAEGLLLASADAALPHDLVLMFDYDAPGTPPEQGGRALRDLLLEAGLGPGSGKTLDVVAHSAGGLIARRLVENEWPRLGAVDRLVLVGVPPGRWPWPDAAEWATFLLSLGLNQLTALAWPTSVVPALASLMERSASVPGPKDLEFPPFIGPPEVPYLVVRGTSSLRDLAVEALFPLTQNLFNRLWERLAQSPETREAVRTQTLDRPSDLASSVAAKEPPSSSDSSCRLEVAADHLTYFTRRASLLAIMGALNPGPGRGD